MSSGETRGCGASHIEVIPPDVCMVRYECRSCGATLSPRPGDCCVFCSYGDVDCEGELIAR
jgi:hypothetical protein